MVRFVESGGESDAGLAPVTPLFGDRTARPFPATAEEVREALDGRIPAIDGVSVRGDQRARPAEPRRGERSETADESTDAAERGLLKKLRARQLSVSEAKSYLVQHELATESVDTIVAAFLDRGYLDDARLAEQIVYAGVDRKGRGRQALAQDLAKRGVPRDIADAALAALPDDDAERALEYARSKAGSMRSLERDVALRRLAGQLARRGYGGSIALTAARTALDEATRPASRVRFH